MNADITIEVIQNFPATIFFLFFIISNELINWIKSKVIFTQQRIKFI